LVLAISQLVNVIHCELQFVSKLFCAALLRALIDHLLVR
jgi:hypothetical protein